MPIEDCRIIELPKITDGRGNLSFVEGGNHVPFDIRRVYYLYDVPPDQERGAHGHKQLEQLIVAVSGSFSIELDDGRNKKQFLLNSPNRGLYVCPMMWRVLQTFSPGSVCMVFASMPYDEDDYFREYEPFLQAQGLME
ncbi:MAG: FdtA/QdtA family cupin domain-containing protein [Gammaproteobacteria bacterium]|nr:FdtA/QdtA family cupin domain-containing protein [Gammaproteobacteria bacterium]